MWHPICRRKADGIGLHPKRSMKTAPFAETGCMFTEANTVEQMILDAVTKLGGTPASMVREDALPYGGESLGDALRPARWTYVSHTDVPRQLSDVMLEPWVREAPV